MNKLVLALGCALAAIPAFAETIACPDLATAVQVATCPAEEELKYTFTGYCADNARMYGKDKDTCASFENYRKLKNVALWESADGAFHAYISCDLPAAALKVQKPSAMAVTKEGKMTRIACTYPGGVIFAYRTRNQCKVQGDGNCAANPSACRASCY